MRCEGLGMATTTGDTSTESRRRDGRREERGRTQACSIMVGLRCDWRDGRCDHRMQVLQKQASYLPDTDCVCQWGGTNEGSDGGRLVAESGADDVPTHHNEGIHKPMDGIR